MKPIWIPLIAGLLCAYSVCFASGPLTYFEVKVAVKISPKLTDPDLSLFVVGQNIRVVNLGIFQLLSGRDGIFAKRAMGSAPFEIAPSIAFEEPALLVEWFNEPEPHNLYIRLAGADSEMQRTLQLIYETGGSLILGDDTGVTFDVENHQNYMRRKYFLETRSHNAYLRTQKGVYRLRELMNSCSRLLDRT